MNWFVFHIVSGQSFFSGVLLVVVAAFASTRTKPVARRISVWAFLLGVILVVISSTAIPYWYYTVVLAVTLVWIVSLRNTNLRNTNLRKKKWCRWIPWFMMAVWTVAVAIEVPFHMMPKLYLAETRSLTIIGDSVTAGTGGSGGAERWPDILARKYGIEIQDISHVGETVASARKRASDTQIVSLVVFLEIGGNDVLSFTSSEKFKRELDALLKQVVSPRRQVIMFELPLPPFCHEYGRIQRTLARKHNVLLVPKRVLLSILASDGSTLDTIHLSQAGHQRMAKCVWEIIGSAYVKE